MDAVAAGRDRESCFLGLDSSTQGLKATLVSRRPRVVHELALNYDADLPAYGTQGGVHTADDGLTVTSPAVMWVEALDVLLERMHEAGWPLDRVAAISGSGQQHGSVWLQRGARDRLRALDPARRVADQLRGRFAVDASPVWMDTSTARECRALEAALGGAQAVADLTGSRAYERFTGNQIAKMQRVNPDAYEQTDRIALVSSFMASLLLGDVAPIDLSDGSGMNLLDIRRRAWDARALEQTAPDLARRLGAPVPSHSVLGSIAPYYVRRFGFPADCQVVAFSGDNPNSLAGLRLQEPGDVALSMGTSDTLFGSLTDPRPSGREGHVFVNPVDPDAYMAMIVRKNGSLTREWIRDLKADGSWDAFALLLEKSPAGNEGHIGFFFREAEITPPLLRPVVRRFDAGDRPVESFPPATEVRAAVEGQFLAMRLHCGQVGLKPARILATGGASANQDIVRVMADVLNVSVYVGEQPNSASLGAAYRALHGWLCARAKTFIPFGDVLREAPSFSLAAEPDGRAAAVYDEMMTRYEKLENRIVSEQVLSEDKP